LPRGGEIVFFNRSWYNRAGVEKVMGFCTKKKYKDFMAEVESFEHLLVHSGMIFIKYYLDISKDEQQKRLLSRKTDPLKQWKISPIDKKAQKYWDAYSKARNKMFDKTSFTFAPWYIVHTDEKKEARINTIKHFLSLMDYPDKKEDILVYDNDILCRFDSSCYKRGLIFS
jgi:polyphosphate kinase 2 (PPK2 family)